MNTALWVIAIILAAAFAFVGMLKLVVPREKLITSMGWTNDFSAAQIKLIGALELTGAIGLILPAVLDIRPQLVGLAAAGLAVTMMGAVMTHVRRKDPVGDVIPGIVLFVLAVIEAIGRLWVQPL